MKASKKDKGRILGEVVSVTGWSRDNARRRLTAAAKQPPGSGRQIAARPRKPRAPKYSYDAIKVLQRVWAASGGLCGKYLAVAMRLHLDALERHGELVEGQDRYSPAVRAELLADECCHDRPVSEASQGLRSDPRGRDDHALAAAAQLDQDPQGR